MNSDIILIQLPFFCCYILQSIPNTPICYAVVVFKKTPASKPLTKRNGCVDRSSSFIIIICIKMYNRLKIFKASEPLPVRIFALTATEMLSEITRRFRRSRSRAVNDSFRCQH